MARHFIYKLDMTALPIRWEVLLGLSGTSGYINGVGTATRLFSPVAIISDNTGNLYFPQGDNHLISKYVISTNTLSTFAGTGVVGFADGPGTSAQFRIPTCIFFDNSGDIIVCDNENNRIRKININTRVVTTIAGTGVAGNQDGIAASATFNRPSWGCCDSKGNFYIADDLELNGVRITSNIRKISNGIVTTLYTGGKKGLIPSSFITHLYYYDNYVYVSEQDSITIYRFAV
jgi:hypothetical protein